MPSRNDLFVVDCLKEIAWPFGHRPEEEDFVQDSAGRLMRIVRDTADLPFARAHEAIAEGLARHLGFAVPAGERRRFARRERYAQLYDTSWLPFSPVEIDDDSHLAGDVLTFDLWLGNRGRHLGALALERVAGDAPSSGTTKLVLLRHQHCFVGLYDEDDEGGAFDPIPPEPGQIAGGHPMAELITSQYDFDPMLQRLERLDESVLRDVLRGVPAGWLNPAQKVLIHEYLMARAAGLRGRIVGLKPFCPFWT